MRQAIQPRNHPFRFLLYIEWGLLTVAFISVLDGPPASPGKHHGPPPGWEHSPTAAIVPLILFGIMGLYLPAGKVARLGHALGQILLILLTLFASAPVFSDGRVIPMVYLVLVIRGCLMFDLAGRVVLTGTAFTLFLAGLQLRIQSLDRISRRLPPPVQRRLQRLIMGFQLNFVVLFGLSLLLVVLLINALLTERQSQQRLQQANQELRRSAQEIEKLAMDQERNRIARDIHDSLGHSLTALNIQLESGLKLWQKDPPRAEQFLKEAKRLGSQSLAEVRQSVATLRHDPLAGQTLESAINQLIENVQSHQKSLLIDRNIQIQQMLPTNLSTILYRIVQEGLTNIVKHADASRVQLQILDESGPVVLTLEDNGSGFDPKVALTGFGLQSMRDRTESTGGTFTITNLATSRSKQDSQKKGTRIRVSLPSARLS